MLPDDIKTNSDGNSARPLLAWAATSFAVNVPESSMKMENPFLLRMTGSFPSTVNLPFLISKCRHFRSNGFLNGTYSVFYYHVKMIGGRNNGQKRK